MINIEKLNKHNTMLSVEGIDVHIKSKHSLYIHMGDWIIYLDNSTNEKIIEDWMDYK